MGLLYLYVLRSKERLMWRQSASISILMKFVIEVLYKTLSRKCESRENGCVTAIVDITVQMVPTRTFRISSPIWVKSDKRFPRNAVEEL